MVKKIKALYLKGDDEIAIQKRLDQIIKDCRIKGLNLIIIDSESVKKPMNLERSMSLFGGSEIFVIKDPVDQKTIKKYFDIKKEEKYEIPKIIYQFLNSFYPDNDKERVSKYLMVKKIEPSDKTFGLLVRHLQDLIWIKLDPKTMTYPEWRIGKLRAQAEKYSLVQLKNVFKALIKIDLKVKTGHHNLEELLDLFVLSRLE